MDNEIEDELIKILESGCVLDEINKLHTTPKEWNYLANNVRPDKVLKHIQAIRFYIGGVTFHLVPTERRKIRTIH
jgi:predicted nucleic acid-binding protein